MLGLVLQGSFARTRAEQPRSLSSRPSATQRCVPWAPWRTWPHGHEASCELSAPKDHLNIRILQTMVFGIPFVLALAL